VENISSEILAKIIALNLSSQEETKIQREEILSCFKEPIFIEEIPNGYCSDYCCRHLPWFIITTSIGRFKIGWRKRVINIDWNKTVGTKEAKEIFPNEDVTKGIKYIHAWSIEKAREYVSTIISSAKTNI